MSYLTHLECSECGGRLDADRLWNLCPECNRPLLARYDLPAVRKKISLDRISSRSASLWRFPEVLPVRDPANRVTLGEGFTPLIHAKRLGTEFGFDRLYIKDESMNPTGSFKARGMTAAVSRAKELGAAELSVPSAGNAAGAMAAYAAKAGLTAHVYLPEDAPPLFVSECRVLGAEVRLVDGLITDCARVAAEDAVGTARFDLSTLKEPYRLEGKKTLGYEIAEQFDWELPDVIVYPTGGGTGLVGMWKAFGEMERLGWIGSGRPRMVAVQSQGCAPIVRAFDACTPTAEPWENANTIADGLRVPAMVGDKLILEALHDSDGTAVAVSDASMIDGANSMGRTEGIFGAPEGGATVAAFCRLRDDGWIKDGERVVLCNTGSGLKYIHLWQR